MQAIYFLKRANQQSKMLKWYALQLNILLNWNQYSVHTTKGSWEQASSVEGSGVHVYFLQDHCFFFIFLICFFSSLWPPYSFFCSEPLTVRWQWWIFCVHTKHTKGSDKGRRNKKANILTETGREQKKNQVEKTHKREDRRTSAKDKAV